MATSATVKKTTAAKKAPAKAAAKKSAAPKWTADEATAAKEYAAELKTAAKRGGKATKADGEADVQAAIAKMNPADKAIAEKLHTLIAKAAPELAPRTWYGMPAYAKDGDTICFFQNAGKFKARYGTLGFSDKASLDDGDLWSTSYAIPAWTPTVEKQVTALLKKAVG